MLKRRPFLAGLAAVGAAAFPSLPGAATRQGFRYGWDVNIAAPTQADLYVSPDGHDDAPGGITTPLRTIQRGVDLLVKYPGGSLAIRGGTYRETVNLSVLHGTSARPFRLHRYGAERVTISAAEKLDGWGPCPAQEAQALGIKGGGVYVTRLPADRLQHGTIAALNLHENGTWRGMAIDRRDISNPEAYGDPDTYHPAEFVIDKDNRILAIRDPRLRGKPSVQIKQTQVLLYHRPNLVSAMDISDFDPAYGELRLANPGPKLQGSRAKPVMRYALRGAGWALEKGTWISRQTGQNEVSVYFRPQTLDHLDRGIEVSVRPTCVEFGSARHVELLGIEAVRAAGADRRSGICMRRAGGDKDPQAGRGLKITHCRVGETLSTGPRGYGAIALRDVHGLTLRHVSLDAVRGGFGLAVLGGESADMRFLHIKGVSNSPARFYTLRHSVLAFSFFENSARDAHANKFNFYEGSDAVLVYGVRCRNVGGYVTYQEASRIYFAFCEFNCDPGAQNRALVAQNRPAGANQGGPDGSGDPTPGKTFYYWNNRLQPDPRHQKKANSLLLGPLGSSQRHGVFNNILHGGGFATVYTKGGNAAYENRSHNRYTGLSFWQSARYGWGLATAEETSPLGQKPRGTGRDMRPIIQREIANLFPGFADWDCDIDGNTVNWEAPPIGSRV